MRHLWGTIAVYIIAFIWVAAASLFGWARSAQIVISNEQTMLAQFDPSPDPQFPWTELGKKGYLRNCANCHGADGRGWDQYPALHHTDILFLSPGGRDYVIDLHLYGLISSRWGVPMPPMGHIQDVELAGLINYVLSQFGNEGSLGQDNDLYRPQDIAERRGRNLSPQEVNARRPD